MKHINKTAAIFCVLILLSLPSAVLLAQQAKQARSQAIQAKQAISALRADSVAYAFGISLAQDLKQRGLSQLNADAVAMAIRDVFQGNPQQVSIDQMRTLITNELEAATLLRDSVLIGSASSFMEKNKLKAGIQTTASGLQYEVIKAGAGEKPGLKDTVQVHYKGSLADGKQFDSSYDRGEPISFQLDNVIPGWQEGLQLMSPGAHYRFYIPYELGYGAAGAGGEIPPYSPLVFEVELLSVSKSAPQAITGQ